MVKVGKRRGLCDSFLGEGKVGVKSGEKQCICKSCGETPPGLAYNSDMLHGNEFQNHPLLNTNGASKGAPFVFNSTTDH
jgi:hypothetical protein